MDKSKAIELLKKEINKIPHLRTLAYHNEKFKLWRDNVKNIIKAALDSEDYQKFSRAGQRGHMHGIMPDNVYQQDYLENLTSYETALKSIVQKYKILGVETKPPTVAEPPMETAELPIHVFDKMQFHPRVIAASKSLFRDGHYASAILEAFKAVNNFVRAKSGLSPNELRGVKDRPLMAKVFDEKEPLIKLNELITDTDINEQEGFKLLFMGATEGIRNPKAHDLIEMKDPYKTLEYLAFASLLLKKIDFWEAD